LADSSGKLTAVDFNIGINRNNTSYVNENTFIDGDKVRFRNGKAEKMSGWVESKVEQYEDSSKSSLTGVARAVKSFVDLRSNKYQTYGTTKKIENILSGQIYDITPLTCVTTVNNIVNTSVGSSLIGISFTAHNRNEGDSVILTSMGVSVGNVLLNGEYTVVSSSNPNVFYVSSSDAATITSVNGGGNITVSFLYHVGDVDNGTASGYGADTWGASTYGTPRTGGSIDTNLRLWSFDTWGEDLLAVPRKGPLFWWDSSNGLTSSLLNRQNVRATVVTSAPAQNSIVFVTLERHAVLLGTNDIVVSTFDPLLVRWSDKEDFTSWTPVSTNSAGDTRLTGGSEIVGYVKTKLENLIFTDKTVISMSYQGYPFYYGFSNLAENSGLISQNGVVEIDGVVYWMGQGAFYKYDGAVHRLDCSLSDYLFKDDPVGKVNYGQKEKIFAGVNKTYNEIMWFYPAGSDFENSRYVIYNFVENCWYDGTIVRTTWEPDTIFDNPHGTFVSVSDSQVFDHDTGQNDGGSAMHSYLESGYFDIADGDQTMFLSLFVPDFDLTGNLTLTLNARKAPFGSVTVKGPYTINDGTAKVPIRVRGREISIKYDNNEVNSFYRLGKVRVNPLPDGKR